MTNRDRMIKSLNGEKTDRKPIIEWATWWNETTDVWEQQGLVKGLDQQKLFEHFGLDSFHQFWMHPRSEGFPLAKSHGGMIIENEQDYEKIKELLYSDKTLETFRQSILKVKEKHDRGDVFIWFTLEGFFWFPRILFGIENHLYSFYDYPELMHKINRDHLMFNLKLTDMICDILTPEFMTIAEDMSYNHGPMLSKDAYDEFIKPYYLPLVAHIKSKGVKVLIDTDGDVEPLVPWFLEAGIEGVLPLERMAGVDVCRIREKYPEFIMIGGFDKTIMAGGEDSIRKEFERIKPAMQSGRYIPSVDHQTPPNCSLENYHTYCKLLKEYSYI